MTGQTPDRYTTRQGAYDLRKLRGKQLVIKPGRTRRYHVPGDAARIITALLTVRDKRTQKRLSNEGNVRDCGRRDRGHDVSRLKAA